MKLIILLCLVMLCGCAETDSSTDEFARAVKSFDEKIEEPTTVIPNPPTIALGLMGLATLGACAWSVKKHR